MGGTPRTTFGARRDEAAGLGLGPTARALVERIGGTPLFPLPSPGPRVRILGKAEWFNPGGSVKDRPAWRIVRRALREGMLPERRLLDASSGNTAIAYAWLGSAIGFPVTLCLPANASPERLGTLRAYGAELVLTDPLEGTDGAIQRARRLAAAHPRRFWYADQYANAENWRAHYLGTATEIWAQTRGRLTHFVAGLGTSGTLVGTGRRLRELRPTVRIVSVEPAEPLHGLEGLKHMETALRPAIYDDSVAHERLGVATEEAQEHAVRLAREAGLLVGPSSGAAYAAALRVAARLEHGTIVPVLPDAGTRYLGGPWWSK
ncbi:MAG: PLP-dependent cysteine synthase family protein [Gemmatimonadota bacterium]